MERHDLLFASFGHRHTPMLGSTTPLCKQQFRCHLALEA
jgi:hypothetical protein